MTAIPAFETPPSIRTVEGRGGDIVVEQLQDCGIEFLFANPSGHMGPVFDAMLDRPNMHLILALHESILAAMADGYAKASGRIPFVLVSRPGFPNVLVHLFNAWRDRTPLVVAADQIDESSRGQFSIQEVDDLLRSAEPFTRWRWESRRADRLAEDIRRAFKFAATPPGGPVFLSIPQDLLAESGVRADIVPQQHFRVDDSIEVAEAAIHALSERLVTATSPLLYVGPEVHRHGAEMAVVELAELLSVPVVQETYGWANAFPTQHPLYLGYHQAGMRYPEHVDFVLNLGGKNPPLPPSAEQAHISLDVDILGRVNPAMLAAMANPKLVAEALTAAVRERFSRRQLQKLAAQRGERTRSYTRRLAESRRQTARARWSDSPISHERLGVELEQALDPHSCIVQLLDSGRIALNYLTFGGGMKSCLSSNGQALGWSLGAAIGVKLAQPERPVVALMGDGDFLFGGSQALWTAQRYQVPVTVVVFDNRSYDNERNRIWAQRSRQAELGRDMTSYIGSPDVEFVALARAYGIAGEKIAEPDQIGPALQRAVAANRAGESYLVDVIVSRRGLGAESAWYPAWSLAAERRKRL